MHSIVTTRRSSVQPGGKTANATGSSSPSNATTVPPPDSTNTSMQSPSQSPTSTAPNVEKAPTRAPTPPSRRTTAPACSGRGANKRAANGLSRPVRSRKAAYTGFEPSNPLLAITVVAPTQVGRISLGSSGVSNSNVSGVVPLPSTRFPRTNAWNDDCNSLSTWHTPTRTGKMNSSPAASAGNTS